VFNNNLPVSSLFCKISLLSLPHCLPARIHYTFCSSASCAFCTIPISMHLLSSVHFSCCTPPPSSHMHHSQHNNNPISSLFHILILPVHLVHSLYAVVLHGLHVECSACSSWQLFSFSVCSTHLSIITGCHTEIPSHHQQSRFFIFCSSRAQLSVAVNGSNALPAVNRLHEQSFLLLADAFRLFTSSVNHTKVSSSPLAETISGFWQLHCDVQQ
jgi:hypothetical protein